MSLPTIVSINLVVITISMLLLWAVSIFIRDTSVVDIFWGIGFAFVAWMTFALTDGNHASRWLLSLLTSIWGLRLAAYLAWRNLGKGEDFRYRAMRETYGRRFPWVSLFLVFGLQGLIMWIVSFPVQVGQSGVAAVNVLHVLGALLWLVGFAFESIGDVQLARFKSNPANQGRVLDRGLWRYTRHPNYFGDFLVWWGLYFVSAASGVGWWTAFSPLLMSFLLLRVSGVALLERSLRDRRPGYTEYIQRTSAFFPWPPKKCAPQSPA